MFGNSISDPWVTFIALTALLGVGVALWGLAYAFWERRARRRTDMMEALRGIPCPYCQGKVRRGDVLCSHCYRDLKRNCPGCGESVSVQARHCPHCQTALAPHPPPSR